jgi:hypothetical protein
MDWAKEMVLDAMRSDPCVCGDYQCCGECCNSVCDSCGLDHCQCDRYFAEQNADYEGLVY